MDVFGGKPPNHVLVNAYEPGQGILPHQDGPLYFPGVCILSLGAPAVIRFWQQCQKIDRKWIPFCFLPGTPPIASVYLAPRSLLVFSDTAYEKSLHGICEVEEEDIDETVINAEQEGLYCGQLVPREQTRISLTIRRVLKVKANLLRIVR